MYKRIAIPTALLLAIAAPTAAMAGWTSGNAGSASAKAVSMPAGPTPSLPTTATQASTSITVTWPTVQYVGTSADVAGYTIKRYKGGTAEAIGGTCSGTQTGTTCTDTVSG